jgi:glycosyltransferase involved in cell wall biosynthesis
MIKNKEIKIDVVIPTFNRLWAIQRVIKYYIKIKEIQKIVIVDDHSDDGTEEWVRSVMLNEPRLCLVRNESNLGAAFARNKGADLCQSPYVFFTDDDLLLENEGDLLVLTNELINSDGDIISPILILPENTSIKDYPDYHLDNSSKTDFLYFCYPLLLERKKLEELVKNLPTKTFEAAQTCGIMLMKREVLKEVRYDEDLGLTSYRDETDFQLKALSHGFRLFACPQINIIEFKHPINNYGGCRASTGLITYEWKACKNNWRILLRHRKTIKNILKIGVPIVFLQLFFIFEHMFKRLPRYLLGKLLRKLKLLK